MRRADWDRLSICLRENRLTTQDAQTHEKSQGSPSNRVAGEKSVTTTMSPFFSAHFFSRAFNLLRQVNQVFGK